MRTLFVAAAQAAIWFRKRGVVFISPLVLLVSAPVAALPIVALDLDPGTPGIQSTRTVAVASSFDVVVTITGVEATGLQAFEIDVGFNPLVLAAGSVGAGGFLPPPLTTVEEDLSPPAVGFALLSTSTATGGGVLATLQFDALALGTSVLDLKNVILSAPFGVEIETAAILDGNVTVVPEPNTLALLTFGLVVLAKRGVRND